MLKNTKIGLIVVAIIIFYLYRNIRTENYGVFSHRATLHGIKDETRNHYILEELKTMFPFNYWNEPNLSIYDKDIRRQHSKRFDPELLM